MLSSFNSFKIDCIQRVDLVNVVIVSENAIRIFLVSQVKMSRKYAARYTMLSQKSFKAAWLQP